MFVSELASQASVTVPAGAICGQEKKQTSEEEAGESLLTDYIHHNYHKARDVPSSDIVW